MMSETLVQTAVCDSCGADVRDESVFCYNCGERVRDESAVEARLPAVPVIESGRNEHVAEPQVIDEHTSAPAARQPGTRPPLRSAASLRKQRRAFNRQPVEVSWERSSRSSVGFVVATIVLVAGALLLLILALYLR